MFRSDCYVLWLLTIIKKLIIIDSEIRDGTVSFQLFLKQWSIGHVEGCQMLSVGSKWDRTRCHGGVSVPTVTASRTPLQSGAEDRREKIRLEPVKLTRLTR